MVSTFSTATSIPQSPINLDQPIETSNLVGKRQAVQNVGEQRRHLGFVSLAENKMEENKRRSKFRAYKTYPKPQGRTVIFIFGI